MQLFKASSGMSNWVRDKCCKLRKETLNISTLHCKTRGVNLSYYKVQMINTTKACSRGFVITLHRVLARQQHDTSCTSIILILSNKPLCHNVTNSGVQFTP